MKIGVVWIFTTLATFALFNPAVFAEEAPKLEGNTFFDQETCKNGPKSPDCVLSFQLFGANAKILYEGMRAKPVFDACIEGQMKDDSNGLRCSKDAEGKYSCDFGYAFAKRKFTHSKVVC